MKQLLGWATGLWLCASGMALGSPTKAPTQDLTKLPGTQKASGDDPLATLRTTADGLISSLLSDDRMYPRLVQLCDRFGPRLSGSANLERAIDWILAELVRDGLSTAHGEPVMVPRWVRGKEELRLTSPSEQRLELLGLGGSVATPPDGLSGPVVVVQRFEELTVENARDKIVVFAPPFVSYEASVPFRRFGAIRAAEVGARAALLRSLTPQSLGTPHTGVMLYKDGVPKIPFAAIAPEAADQLLRQQRDGQRIEAKLSLHSQTLPPSPSRNIVVEVKGRERPDEVVLFGCHIDSWDVGQGAHDDAGNCVAAWAALRAVQSLRPRRTIRLVMWTNEENGSAGAKAYAAAHGNDKHVIALEADSGVFRPTGFLFSGDDAALAKVHKVAQLLAPLQASMVGMPGGGADLRPLADRGVPVVGLQVAGERYFVYHHSAADTVDKVDPVELKQVAAALAVFVYGASELW